MARSGTSAPLLDDKLNGRFCQEQTVVCDSLICGNVRRSERPDLRSGRKPEQSKRGLTVRFVDT